MPLSARARADAAEQRDQVITLAEQNVSTEEIALMLDVNARTVQRIRAENGAGLGKGRPRQAG